MARERKEGAMVRFDPRLVVLAVGVASLAASAASAQTTQIAPSPVMVARPAVQQPASSAPHFYMKIDGITGESTDTAHPGWIDIHSFQWGTSAAVGSKAAGATAASRTAGPDGRPSITSLNVTKTMDKASPVLQQATAEGKHFKTVVLDFVSRTKGEYYQITMIDPVVSSFRINSASDRPTESITFQFGKFEIKYGKVDAQGIRGPSQIAPPTLDIRLIPPN
jgi:type VI secretion system secreted protein Hcp